MRVLVVKTSSMGDVLHTLPALTDAANHIPNITFDWVVEENFAQIPSWHFAVDTVIPVAIRRWRKNWFSRPVRKERHQFIQQLRQQQYDCIIDAQGLIKSAFLITRKARGIKHGLDRQSIKEPIASWFYDVKHHVPKQMHAIERVRLLFAKSLNYTFPNHTGDYAIARHFTQVLPEDAMQYLVFLHATTRDEKHWTEDAWRELIKQIEPTGLTIKLPWGAPHEEQRALRLAKGFQHVQVLPKLALDEIATIIAGAKAVVSVDTGLSHLTAALDRPNITLFGQTDPKLIGGYGKNQHSIISADKSMQSISANQVYEKLAHFL
ncbi:MULTISPECIES: lipopolysaccharide heptosyltransferase RfaC [unclassified Gilliamella]|uniref:lipopolysaccharide heptosyltransferase RfaC n=1 Tax=unclassified Gilliamella TaxID=2685620 RepID=UPI002269D8CF|nr:MULTISPECIES: lipopolysaccharide heptosyltransferase RfaC [unclassified Gilliamella]MCX8600798.1 lipopolysaccharide heptosyltransferase RfaC [Gilliamella sp. B3722]MCX8609077.1 lipopolysaccharide heptosyltransferase RfaC [Gilliamella sp. B3771]MCX8610018.1 lipopolysaccharide heptosyltransferase RfaC [Gilliamella sp. B3891]MCX8612722.1 lipopolysaccharide heptosyltransferase RfaC [Gilliamella sp. B3773]MCX8616631.1 lipopolysaccharide heptosyltransferase RfaC [Gilliamella sp. B3770]